MKGIEGIQLNRNGPAISHLFFADDTLIFLKAEKDSCRNLVRLIDEYCSASGQQVNLHKPNVLFGRNVPACLANELTCILGMDKVDDPWGVPGCPGKEVLIKAVAQAIPEYPMNLFKFPITFCKELDVIIADFWWGQKEGEHRIHWVSKEKLCLSKANGGLGFINFVDFNDALLAKQCWRLISEPNSKWAEVLKARYFPNCSFLDAEKGGRALLAWSSLLAGRDILLGGAHW
ncbi:uncharacterized mitochondrial protein AtMg00310-like [Pyrus communis]|uniref:uncharacterized mitochondrial protein AtMg00310-like n=1 Tax=Pyrus communis TaxID=23211 RepID=UPI0035BEDEDD